MLTILLVACALFGLVTFVGYAVAATRRRCFWCNSTHLRRAPTSRGLATCTKCQALVIPSPREKVLSTARIAAAYPPACTHIYHALLVASSSFHRLLQRSFLPPLEPEKESDGLQRTLSQAAPCWGPGTLFEARAYMLYRLNHMMSSCKHNMESGQTILKCCGDLIFEEFAGFFGEGDPWDIIGSRLATYRRCTNEAIEKAGSKPPDWARVLDEWHFHLEQNLLRSQGNIIRMKEQVGPFVIPSGGVITSAFLKIGLSAGEEVALAFEQIVRRVFDKHKSVIILSADELSGLLMPSQDTAIVNHLDHFLSVRSEERHPT